MVNLDMVGRLRNRELEVHGAKTSLEADSILNALNSDSLFRLKLVPDGLGSSDHASFTLKIYPFFLFTPGYTKITIPLTMMFRYSTLEVCNRLPIIPTGWFMSWQACPKR